MLSFILVCVCSDRSVEESDFQDVIIIMSHKEAIDFENALDGAGPLKSEVVARWQRKIRDKSQQQSQAVRIQIIQ